MKIVPLAIVFAILAWIVSLNMAHAYNPNHWSAEQESRMYEQQDIERYHEEDMQDMQNQIDQLRRDEEGY